MADQMMNSEIIKKLKQRLLNGQSESNDASIIQDPTNGEGAHFVSKEDPTLKTTFWNDGTTTGSNDTQGPMTDINPNMEPVVGINAQEQLKALLNKSDSLSDKLKNAQVRAAKMKALGY